MKRPRVISTRDASDADNMLAHEAGMELVSLPFYEFRPYGERQLKEAVSEYASADAWVFTSAKAVRALAGIASWENAPACYAVGPATAEALADLSVTAQLGLGNAEGLGVLLAKDLPSHAKLVHWCGAQRRPELREGLAKQGRQLAEVVCYAMDELPLTTEAVRQKCVGAAAVLVYSPRAAERYMQLAEGLKELNVIVPGPTTMGSFEEAGWPHVLQASKPTTAAMLAHVHGFVVR